MPSQVIASDSLASVKQGACYNPDPYFHFPPTYSALLVTRSPLVPLRAAWTATKPPDKSPDESPDHSAVRYHMPSLRSL